MSKSEAWLVLADGTAFRGEAFGAETEGEGEVVFHTGMSGYQEILTDPSYAGQIVCMTYPEIGNTGTNPEDEESRGVFLRGFVVRDHVDFPSSWRSTESLDAYLKRHGVPGLTGIDTRALVRHIRSAGAVNGVIARGEVDREALRARAAAVPSMEGRNLVDEVSCDAPYTWTEPGPWSVHADARPQRRFKVVAYDFGIKRNILREMYNLGLDVTVVPARTPAREVLAMDAAGYFLSNGPGDPDALPFAAEAARTLVESGKPVFGICLGHQVLGLALGGRTRKMSFGHHGANQPAREGGRVMITSENHGFALDRGSLADDPELEITHHNLNDQTVEGLRHRQRPVFSVQYHPEASPGPHDTSYLFARFRELIEEADAAS